MSVDWGNVPTWIGAIVTSGALSVSAATLALHLRDRRRASAATVNAWASLANSAAPDALQAQVRNSGAEPAYKIKLTFIIGGEESHSDEFDVIPPKELTTRPASQAAIDHWYRVLTARQLPGTGVDRYLPRVRLAFTDSAGRRWERTEFGQLQRVRSRTGAPHV